MKHLGIIVALLFLSVITGKAQNNNRISAEFSGNNICLAYQLNFEKTPVYSGVYVGLGNQDINSKFDDVLFGIKPGMQFISFAKSNIFGHLNAGIYFPNNKYYDAITPFVGINIGYEKFLGKQKMHSLFIETGYIYGQKEYTQIYENDILYVSSIDKFILFPVIFSLAYGFNF